MNYLLLNKWRKFFFINLGVGIFTFFMLISQQLLNQLDAIWHYGYGGAGNWERTLGRWLLPLVDNLRFGLLTDPFCNVLALCIFILGNIIIFKTVEFKHDEYRTYIISCMFIVSTSMGVWLSFRYTSDGYAIAYLFALLPVYLNKVDIGEKVPLTLKLSNRKLGVAKEIAAVVCASVSLMISLACYQAFFDSTCLLMLTVFMLMLYRNEEASVLIRFFVKSVASIILGATLYFINTKIVLAKHGIDHIGTYNKGNTLGLKNTIEKIPEIIGKTIYYFDEYYFNTLFRWNRLQEHVSFRVLFFSVIITAFIVGIIRIAKKNLVYAMLFTICGLLLPLATNVVLFMATESFLSIQMTNGLAMFIVVSFILVFEILVEKQVEDGTDNAIVNVVCRINVWGGSSYSKKIVSTIVVLASILVIYGNYISTQIDQEACREGRTGTINLAGEILDSLKNLGYADRGGSVCFVGVPCSNERFMYSEIYPMANELMQFGNWGKSASTHGQTWCGIYREYFGYFVSPCTNEEYEAIISRDDIVAMPMYPRQGSIKDVDGIIVVKVSNNY